MTKQEKLEQKIRELVPELQELSFGCEVIPSQWSNSSIVTHVDSVPRVYIIGSNAWHTVEKIIGHSIHLEHVMQALPTQADFYHEPTRIGIRLHYGIEKEPTDYVWYNLKKPFSQQSPTLYQFLADVLL